MNRQTITITFGDQAENHVGMQKIGEMATEGFNKEDLEETRKWFEERNTECKLINLSDYLPESEEYKIDGDAYLLIIKKGLDTILRDECEEDIKTSKDFFDEQNRLEKDTKAYMYGRVVNKKARYNLCFGLENQEPDYEKGKGRIIRFEDLPLLNKTRQILPKIIGEKARNLMAEANYYYDIGKCGIGFHGDAERKKVIGIRVGASLPLHFQWFVRSKAIGERLKLQLDHGDIYIMSEKTTGFDWKKKTTGSGKHKKDLATLRHAAGCSKYLTI